MTAFALWWLSYSNPDFLGVAIVEADSLADATARADQLGINPGGTVNSYGPYPASAIAVEWRNRLLTLAEADLIPCCTTHGDGCTPTAEPCCHFCPEADPPAGR